MNKPKKVIVTGLAAASIASAGLFTGARAFAASPTDTTTIDSIAQQLHLEPSQVSSVVKDFTEQKQADRDAKFTARLDKAVKDGKLTATQETAILTERQTIETKVAAIAKITDATQRKQQADALRQQVTNWAKQNSIPLKWLHSGTHLYSVGN